MERIVTSVLRHYGLTLSLTSIQLVDRDWKIDISAPSGQKTSIVAADSNAHGVRRAVMAALQIDG